MFIDSKTYNENQKVLSSYFVYVMRVGGCYDFYKNLLYTYGVARKTSFLITGIGTVTDILQ